METDKGNDFIINLIIIGITVLITVISTYILSRSNKEKPVKKKPVFDKYDIEGFLEGLE